MLGGCRRPVHLSTTWSSKSAELIPALQSTAWMIPKASTPARKRSSTSSHFETSHLRNSIRLLELYYFDYVHLENSCRTDLHVLFQAFRELHSIPLLPVSDYYVCAMLYDIHVIEVKTLKEQTLDILCASSTVARPMPWTPPVIRIVFPRSASNSESKTR